MFAMSELITPRRIAEILEQALGEPVVIPELTRAEFDERAKSDNVFVLEMYLMWK
jgi:hypothetical protein